MNNLTEYIEREAAYQTLTEYYHHTTEGMHSALREAISRVLAADVQPVVLCRDCKYAPIGDNDGSDLEWPFNEFDENPCPYKCLDNWYSHKPAPDFFCAAGGRKADV